MIKSITVTNYLGDCLKLDLRRPEESGFVVKSITGLGPGKANINTTESPTIDGGLYNSARLPVRNIVLALDFLDVNSIEDVRQKSYEFFPIKKPLRLMFETDNRCVEIDGYVESNDPNIFSKAEGSDISIICPKYFFYLAGKNSTNTTIFCGTESLFEFAFSNESLNKGVLEMGNIQNLAEKTIVYEGDSEIGITITIHILGEVRDITIYNVNTHEAMYIYTAKITEIIGNELLPGDDIIICTEKGNKSVILQRDGEITNIINCLASYSDWIELKKGDNVLVYTAAQGGNNLQFKIENRTIYTGI